MAGFSYKEPGSRYVRLVGPGRKVDRNLQHGLCFAPEQAESVLDSKLTLSCLTHRFMSLRHL